MLLLSFVSMYVLMYSMVDTFDNVFMSFNQVYMAGLMAAPMGVIELFLMGAMYRDRRLNAVVVVGSVLVFVLCWTFIRQQTAVADRQFLRSMIPHHAGAILMCEEASIQDPRIKELCKSIIAGQQHEIDQMTTMLAER
jgi:hypothetical protein